MGPIHSQGSTAAAECSWLKRCHVQAAVAIAQTRSRPVLLTVPSSVIPPPSSATPSKRFSFKTGFDVLISCATLHSPYTNRSTTILRQAGLGQHGLNGA